MRFGTRGRYAVTALADLAGCGVCGPICLAGIAERQRISLSYLEQLFVGHVHLRREALDEAVQQLQDLPYSVWSDVIQSPLIKTVTVPNGKSYRITVTAKWNRLYSDDIRVTIRLNAGWFRRALRESFVITSENKFLET